MFLVIDSLAKLYNFPKITKLIHTKVLITILISVLITPKSYPHIHFYFHEKPPDVVIHRVIMKF